MLHSSRGGFVTSSLVQQLVAGMSTLVTHLDDRQLVQLAAETARQLESVWDEVRYGATFGTCCSCGDAASR